MRSIIAVNTLNDVDKPNGKKKLFIISNKCELIDVKSKKNHRTVRFGKELLQVGTLRFFLEKSNL